MLYKKSNAIILLFLVLFLSKEIFSYDEEKVIVLCIVSFLTIAYFNSREMIFNSLNSKVEKIHNEFYNALDQQVTVLNDLRRFWKIFLDLEDQVIEIFLWVKHNLKLIIKKQNKNRSLFIFFLIKNELNYLLRDQFAILKNLYLYTIKTTFNNFRLLKSNKIENNNKYLENFNFNFVFNNLKNIVSQNKLTYLILNKLNIKNEFTGSTSNKWIDAVSYLNYRFTIK